MTRRVALLLWTLVCVTAGLLAVTEKARAEAGDVLVERPFARATAGDAVDGQIYCVIQNTAEDPDRLIGGRTDAAAELVIAHHVFEDGAMRMRDVAAIGVGAGGTVALRPGGKLVRLVGLTAPLVEGGTVTVTLRFERAGEVEVVVPIAGPDARDAP